MKNGALITSGILASVASILLAMQQQPTCSADAGEACAAVAASLEAANRAETCTPLATADQTNDVAQSSHLADGHDGWAFEIEVHADRVCFPNGIVIPRSYFVQPAE